VRLSRLGRCVNLLREQTTQIVLSEDAPLLADLASLPNSKPIKRVAIAVALADAIGEKSRQVLYVVVERSEADRGGCSLDDLLQRLPLVKLVHPRRQLECHLSELASILPSDEVDRKIPDDPSHQLSYGALVG